MGLVVKELRLADFRSFERLELHPSEGVTVLVGPNAAGKTNTVEALQLLTAGSSFRKPTPRQLVRGNGLPRAAFPRRGVEQRAERAFPPLFDVNFPQRRGPQPHARSDRRRPVKQNFHKRKEK